MKAGNYAIASPGKPSPTQSRMIPNAAFVDLVPASSDRHADRFQCVHDHRVVRHLRFKEVPLFGVIVASWLIAFVEYCLAVPANRFGSSIYSTAQLKTIQEVITLAVFAGFSVAYLREPLTWNYAIGFAFIAVGAYFVFAGPFGR